MNGGEIFMHVFAWALILALVFFGDKIAAWDKKHLGK
jgi:hypothetical protein